MVFASDLISINSINFLVDQEDGDKAYYEKTEAHFDWPGGESGPTIAVGYDLGYVTAAECMSDWGGIIDPDMITRLIPAIGLTGDRAHLYVQDHRTEVTISFADAIKEFVQREIPKWDTRMRLVLPNYEMLPPDSRGAILSVGYNRGTAGFTSNLPRYREMAEIRDEMAAQNFRAIPALIEGMARLWPNVPDLVRRRRLEAQLFAQGLASWTSPSSTPTSGSDSSSTSPSPSQSEPSA